MDDALTDLPLKSLELPTKLVAKLKPLAVKTVGELYAVPLERILDLGLLPRELEELAEAATDFGVAWHGKAEVLAAAQEASPPNEPAPEAASAKARVKHPPKKPTGDGATHPGGKTAVDPALLEAASAFSRVRVISDLSIGGRTRPYAVAVVDLGALPVGSGGELAAHQRSQASAFEAVLTALGRRRGSGHQIVGAALVFPILAKERPRVERLARAHAEARGLGPAFTSPVPTPFVAAMASGLVTAHCVDDALPLVPPLMALATGLSTSDALAALELLAAIHAPPEHAEAGRTILRDLLTPQALEAARSAGGGRGEPLVAAAAACAQGGDASLAVAALRVAFEVDRTPTHLKPLRGGVLDDERFRPLWPRSDFRALYRGYPAYEARLNA